MSKHDWEQILMQIGALTVLIEEPGLEFTAMLPLVQARSALIDRIQADREARATAMRVAA